MAVLVTGATGEIGQPLLDQLERSRVVRVLSRRPPPNGERATEWVQGDVNDPETLVRACEGADPVLHMAAVTHARRTADYFRVNITGTANLIDAARRAGVRPTRIREQPRNRCSRRSLLPLQGACRVDSAEIGPRVGYSPPR